MSTAANTAARPNLFSILRHRNFALLWLGQAISQIGDSIFSIAMMWLVLQLTGSALAMATIPILATLPRLAFQLIGGVSVDRYDRRLLMLGSDAIRGAVVLALAILIATNQIQLFHVYVLQVVFGVVGAFFYPAQSALVPNLVSREGLVAANSLTGLTFQLAQIVGPALGGALVVLPGVGIAGACFVDALSFGAGVIGLAIMRIPRADNAARNGKRSMWQDLRDGLRYLFGFRTLVLILLMAMVLNFAMAPVGVVLPILVKDNLGLGAEAFGVLMSAFGAGAVAGSLVVGVWAPTRRRGALAFGMMALIGILCVPLGMMPVFLVVLSVFIAQGWLIAMVNPLIGATMQGLITDEYRGRVSGVNILVAMGLTPVGLALGGALADVFGAGLVIVAGGVLTTVVALAGLLFREIRELQ